MDSKTQKLYDSLFNGFDWADVVNMTPHPCVVFGEVEPGKLQEVMTLEPCGQLPRVVVIETEHPKVHLYPWYVVKNQLGKVEGLPDKGCGRLYVVSRMVLDALPSDRDDCLAPDDTGKTAVRDDKGHILGVTQFVGK